jgi:PEP-CTERM motif
MKKTLILVVLAVAAYNTFGQGTISMGNQFAGFQAPIYGPDPSNPLMSVSGQSSVGLPTGSTVYGGPLLQGSGYTFALFAGPANTTDPAALVLVATTTFRTGAAAGYVRATEVPIPSIAPAQTATVQVRVWDNQGGTVGSWANVLASPSIARGESALFQTGALGGPNPPNPPGTAPNLTGWQSFNVHQVPEPSVIALGALGLGALLLRRRKS